MPRLAAQFIAYVRALLRRNRADYELDEELQYHLDREIAENLARGLTPLESRRAAFRMFGAVSLSKEECRELRPLAWIGDIARDLRYGVRTLRKNLAFTSAAVLALALGAGANTAMFSIAYGLLLRPLPYPDAGRIAVVYMSYFPRDFRFGTMCVRDYLTWQQENRAFETPALFTSQRIDIAGGEDVPEQVDGASVTSSFFSTLAVPPLIGRTFESGEDQPGARLLAVLSETIWRRRFSANSEVLGRTILVNGTPSTVIGVMPRAFQFPRAATEVWTVLRLDPPTRYGPWFYRGLARLKPGVTLEQARSELDSIAARMMQVNPYYKRLTLPVLTLRDAQLGMGIRPALLIMTAAVALVLLIAIVNVANLMLARAAVRRREMALRLSLGAARGCLLRQLLTESVLLSLTGAVAGLAFAWGAIVMLRLWNPGRLPFIDSVRLDSSSLVFTFAVAVATGILFGLAPAFESARTDLNIAIKQGERGFAGPGRKRNSGVLVISEVALSLTLLIAAGLLLHSFFNLRQVTGGFYAPPKQILTMLVSPTGAKYKDARAGAAYYAEVLRVARGVPGVEAAALTSSLPPDRQGDADTFRIEGQTLAPGAINPVVSVVVAAPDLFRTLRIPLLAGRDFTAHDSGDSKLVTIVSEGFARRFFPNGRALGKRIKQSGPGLGGDWMEIVGVAGNVKYLGPSVETDPAYYMPFEQSYTPRMYLAVRSSRDASSVAEIVRERIQAVDRGVTLAQVTTMDRAIGSSVSQPRFDAMLLALFAAIALLLACVGVYGLISYSIARRTQEIGVRMALGASRASIMGMIIREGALLGAIGVAIGLGASFVFTRVLATMLFGIDTVDALTFVAAPFVMMLVVVLATLLPAVRATRLSPVAALQKT